MSGASVIVIGAGVTGLSSAWWLARSGVDVLVIDKGIVGWEASGRNGGGASHYHSPLFHEEQRLWPQMDGLLGYTTEYRRERVIFATTDRPLPARSAPVAGCRPSQGRSRRGPSFRAWRPGCPWCFAPGLRC